jgi:hypothetical protein
MNRAALAFFSTTGVLEARIQGFEGSGIQVEGQKPKRLNPKGCPCRHPGPDIRFEVRVFGFTLDPSPPWTLFVGIITGIQKHPGFWIKFGIPER